MEGKYSTGVLKVRIESIASLNHLLNAIYIFIPFHSNQRFLFLFFFVCSH